MGYHYDPILCMNVPDSTSKAKDAKALDDARSDFSKVIALTKQIDEITRKYARKIDANAMFAYTDQIRNKVQYYIDNASRGWYDSAPAEMRDEKPLSKMDMNELRALYVSLGGDIKKTYGTSKQAMILKIDDLKRKGKDVPQRYLDRAIRTADKFTVWESDEYDDIYVSYEGGTYVLYVENRPQADGSQQKMIQLAKQEERMRG